MTDQSAVDSDAQADRSTPGISGTKSENLVVLGVLFAIFVFLTIEAGGFKGQARAFPFWAGLAGIVAVTLETISVARLRLPAAETLASKVKTIGPFILWIGALLLLMWGIGVPVAASLFAFVFLRKEGSMPWLGVATSSIAIILFLILLTDVMNLRWPDAALFDPLSAIGIEL